MAEKDPYIEKAYEELERMSADEKKRLEYEAREKALRDYNSQMSSARRRGEAIGKEIGERNRKSWTRRCLFMEKYNWQHADMR